MNPISWIGSLLSGIFNLAASWMAGRVAVGQRKNTPEMVANAVAKDDAAAKDKTESTLAAAHRGNAKSLEELRREAAE